MAYTLNQLRGAWGAGHAAAEKKMNRPPLVGKYFHSVEEGKINWQGKILAELPGSMYQIQLFSWLDGGATSQRLVTLADMRNWLFYETNAAWVAAGDKVAF